MFQSVSAIVHFFYHSQLFPITLKLCYDGRGGWVCDFTTVWWMTTPQAGSSQPRIGCITDPGHGVNWHYQESHRDHWGSEFSLVLSCSHICHHLESWAPVSRTVSMWTHQFFCQHSHGAMAFSTGTWWDWLSEPPTHNTRYGWPRTGLAC